MGKATRWFKGLFGVNKPSPKNPQFFTHSISGRHAFDSAVLCNNPATIPPNITPAEAAWLSFCCSESEKQSKNAIAVAAATAAAADAAVAAARAAVAVVRITSRGRSAVCAAGCCGGGAEDWVAAIRIQSAFRGYLARKALRALKGVVKIQALMRGYLVRKEAKATLNRMQALIRAQATVRSRRVHSQQHTHTHNHSAASNPQFFRPRRSLEIFDGSKSEQETAVHSRRLSASFECRIEDIPKIVEMDPGQPTICEPNSFSTPRLSILNCEHHFANTEQWGLMRYEYGPSSAQSTPRFTYLGPVTPSRSVCGDNGIHFVRHCKEHPNYMAKTQSFRAKARSQSAPKQRPEVGPKHRVSLSGASNFKNIVMGKLERSCEFGMEPKKRCNLFVK